jgi:sugar phosphate isomerase/epimerase
MRTLLALAALGLALLALPATASAEKKAIWGPVTLPGGASAFPIYEELGVDVLQLQVQWRSVATQRPDRAIDPADPAYRWPAELDEAVAMASTYGIDVALMVRNTPGWANGGRTGIWAPDDAQDYAEFMRAASRRYPSVDHWMVWGEPTRQGSFQPVPRDSRVGPRRYAKLLDAAYEQLKREDSDNVVIGGMSYSSGDVKPTDWLRWMRLPNGLPPRLDLYGHNPFSNRFPDIDKKPYREGVRDISDIDSFHRQLQRDYGPSVNEEIHRQLRRDHDRYDSLEDHPEVNRRHKELHKANRWIHGLLREKGPDLWLSEFTIGSAPSDKFPISTTPEAQARWLRAAYDIAREADYVETLGWFNLVDDPATPEGGLKSGLMTFEGARKPAFPAYQEVP